MQADDRRFTASGDVGDLDGIRQFAVAYLRHEQDKDLQAFRLRFDRYYLESSLYAGRRRPPPCKSLIDAGKTYEGRRAVAAHHRLRRRQGPRDAHASPRGGYTYFVPDVAYHTASGNAATARPSTSRAPTTTAPSRACAGLLSLGVGIPEGYPTTCCTPWCAWCAAAREVKISKRAGSYVTLRDLIDWTSADAVRFSLLSRKPDTEYTFDVDLAVQQNNDNRCTTCSTPTPASARCCRPGAAMRPRWPTPTWRRWTPRPRRR